MTIGYTYLSHNKSILFLLFQNDSPIINIHTGLISDLTKSNTLDN